MQSSESESSSLVTLRLSKKDVKKKLKALKIMADVFVFIILEFIEPTLNLHIDEVYSWCTKLITLWHTYIIFIIFLVKMVRGYLENTYMSMIQGQYG